MQEAKGSALPPADRIWSSRVWRPGSTSLSPPLPPPPREPNPILASSYTCSPPPPARPAFTEPVIESKKAKTARAVLVLGAPGGRPWNWKEEEGSIGTCKLNWIPSSACMCLCSAASDHAIPPGKHAIKMLVSKKQNRERDERKMLSKCQLSLQGKGEISAQ